MIRRSPALLVMLAVPALTAPTFADLTASPLTATADTFVTSANPTHNFGAAGALQVSAPGLPHGELQSLLRFNTAAAVAQFNTQFGPGNWTLTAATLSMGTNFGAQGANPNNPIFNLINAGDFRIDWLQNDTWLEGSGTPEMAGVDEIAPE